MSRDISPPPNPKIPQGRCSMVYLSASSSIVMLSHTHGAPVSLTVVQVNKVTGTEDKTLYDTLYKLCPGFSIVNLYYTFKFNADLSKKKMISFNILWSLCKAILKFCFFLWFTSQKFVSLTVLWDFLKVI